MGCPISLFSHRDLVNEVKRNFPNDRDNFLDTEKFLDLTTLSLHSREKAKRVLNLLFKDLIIEGISIEKIDEKRSSFRIDLQRNRDVDISRTKVATIGKQLYAIIEGGRIHLEKGTLSVIEPSRFKKIFFKIALLLLKNSIELDIRSGEKLDLALSEEGGTLRLKIGDRYDKKLTDQRLDQLVKCWTSWADVIKV